MSLSDKEFLELQTAVAGRYSIERELGRGGMGIVYLAHDVQLQRPVAIKLLAPALAENATMRARFVREARLAANCFHPNIVPIHSVEESGSLAWYVMAYVRGESLAERVRRTGPLSAENVRRLAEDIGWALAYAHDRGVVHRDVKPENILIDATSERFLLADFGIALQNDPSRADNDINAARSMAGPMQQSSRLLEKREAAGTPRYMAPEQARGEPIDGRADLYALGASLFHAASGRPPFDAPTTLALLHQHASMNAPSVRTYAPLLNASLADAIDQCLAKLPSDRFASAAQFVGAIAPTVAETPLPPSLQPVHATITDARNAATWASVIGATSVLLMLGERNHSFARDIILSIGSAMGLFMAGVATLRTTEATLAARRALKAGIDQDVVLSALVGRESPDTSNTASRRKSAWLIAAGMAGALAQGHISRLDGLPEALEAVLQVGMLFGPAYAIGRGIPGVVRGSRFGRFLRNSIGMPIAGAIVKVAGAFVPSGPARTTALKLDAPTELRLEDAVRSVMQRLPDSQRELVQGANAAAAAFAREARTLRAHDDALLARERLTRQETTSPERAGALLALRLERTEVQSRLATAVAALETLRLDLLRLDAATPSGTGLTSHLSVVRDLARRIDAAAEVRAYLANSTPTPV